MRYGHGCHSFLDSDVGVDGVEADGVFAPALPELLGARKGLALGGDEADELGEALEGHDAPGGDGVEGEALAVVLDAGADLEDAEVLLNGPAGLVSAQEVVSGAGSGYAPGRRHATPGSHQSRILKRSPNWVANSRLAPGQ